MSSSSSSSAAAAFMVGTGFVLGAVLYQRKRTRASDAEEASDFAIAKKRLNLMFDESEYVKDVADFRSGPFSKQSLLKYDKRKEGLLSVGDEVPDGEVALLDESEGQKTVACPSSFVNGGRPLVLTFGSFS